MYVGAYIYIASVVIVGVGLGVWLQGKLEGTNQNIQLPSAFKKAA